LGKEIKKLKKMKKLLCLLAILMPMLSVDCFAQNYQRLDNERQSLQKNFEILRASQFQFQNLKGVNIYIELTEDRDTDRGLSLSHSNCFIMPTVNYIKAMGFDDTGENEHTLTIELSKIVVHSPSDYHTAVVGFRIKLTNREGKIIFEQVVESDIWDQYECLNEAYTQSLEKINWYKIASFLKKSSEAKQLAKEEPRKEVEGYGNTALENTIVRWDVQSRPAGADVFWRVVSKTPSVKSTNNKYLQTTPYEATKSLDIRGLSYENSGDVRIILRCEKEGYHSQEKEFNVRMIIDQEEISAFFRLVKEE
jgi:hypothetical protein